MILALEADINSLYGKSHLGLGQMEEAITRHRLEFQVAKRTGNEDIKFRAMDNLAVSSLFPCGSRASLVAFYYKFIFRKHMLEMKITRKQ